MLSRSDLADFNYFVAIARHSSFRRAGLEVGISASALSHALKGLEARLGVRLLNRTNRSVTLTAAGDELLRSIGNSFDAIEEAVEVLNRFRESPVGRIRLNVVSDAGPLLIAPVLPAFIDRFPDIEVDIVSSNRMVDVIGDGFDAGVRYGGTVPQDMIAQKLSSDLRWVTAASPDYFRRFGVPETPADLVRHRCIGVRLGNDRIYQWEFQGEDGEYALPLPNAVTIDDSRIMLELAVRGGGVAYGPEPIFRRLVAEGALQIVLADYAATGPGFEIYYPSRRQVPTALRLLIDEIREADPLGIDGVSLASAGGLISGEPT